MLLAYPAAFYYDDKESSEAKYFITFPDFGGMSGTQGTSIPDAIRMASDWLGIAIADFIENGEEPPQPSTISNLILETANPYKDDTEFNYDPSQSFISMVTVNIDEYLGQQEPVKKTLTIPKWADKLGREMDLNFSQTLTEAITEKSMRKRA
ncbi:phage-like protein [Lysinibacillus sphaericus]|uniref:type II toxin-antitoxin system HicB family antitoxin n=1 Tax=Lysinibacillus sphaericus TaxID=1421 RepID=UPI0018CDF61A|nr:type II toxin-antitoxin system HicB family antitoxin [Lysinibacillus sphaericus]MBG9455751.1 phage-like protein [Lysinibacillus sphaericus]MBG9477770.1 phage-like protein [Lysinibacillus sphaericus]MBG9593229.1 phage-like protein [Lysinibacillus sphaericus]